LLFEVWHLTRFTYDRSVSLEPMAVRLRPRTDLFQRLISFEMEVDPRPQGVSDLVDAEGNAVSQVWFVGATPALAVRTRFTVETLRSNPFDYIVLDPESLRIPMTYSDGDHRVLARYLEPPADPAVRQFAAAAQAGAGTGGATSFLGELCSRISGSIAQEIRPVGDAMAAGETLARRSGACRDLAVLFVDACRSVGIAARFVTGYEMGEADGDRDLHAWAEVYLNGAGWRGYDPSQGLAVADRHVSVAVGPGPAEAAPTQGTFRGTGATSTLETVITLRVPTYAPNPYQAAATRPAVRMTGLAPPAETSRLLPER
jgi:transglutaminase-like putative cysteine protease